LPTPPGRHQRPRWAPEDGGCSGDRIRVIYPVMYKIIGIILAVMPVVLFLRAIFMRSKKTSQAVSEFKKQLDYAVWLILFFIGCAVVYSVGKLIYQFWT
jgi:succinate dehydrogenase/fumarate reductase cytochrome b subunit